MEDKSLKDCTEEFLAYIEGVKGFSSNSVTAYREDYLHLYGSLGQDAAISSVTAEDLRQIIGNLSRNNYKSSSINRFIAAVRSLFAYCKKFGYIQNNVALELKTLKNPKRLPKYMTQSEIDQICALPEQKKILWPARDKALFEMLYSSGCRVSEIAGLKFGDFLSPYGEALVLGKGSKERRVFFGQDAQNCLEVYLKERQELFRKLKKDPGEVKEIFVNQNGNALTAGGIWYIIKRYSGVEGTNTNISPHAFRHTFATAMLNNGADIRVVQEMLGHASINTTQRYTHVTKERLKEVYQQSFPHSGKGD